MRLFTKNCLNCQQHFMCLRLLKHTQSDTSSLHCEHKVSVNETDSDSTVPAGGGVTLRGSDGQLHPRAPPKPLRVSAIFPNSVPPPPRDRNYDPSSFYDELVVQVRNSSWIPHSSVHAVYLSSLSQVGEKKKKFQSQCGVNFHLLSYPGATVQTEGSCGPTACRGEVAEPRPPHRDVVWLSGGTEERSVVWGAVAAAEEVSRSSGRLAFWKATCL